MPVESRTRITLFLPAPSTLGRYLLADAVLSELVQICGGVTASLEVPSVFMGRWFDASAQQTREDANVMVLADAPVPPERPGLVEYLETLKLRCQQDFVQDVIWMTIHGVGRIAANDYVRWAIDHE